MLGPLATSWNSLNLRKLLFMNGTLQRVLVVDHLGSLCRDHEMPITLVCLIPGCLRRRAAYLSIDKVLAILVDAILQMFLDDRNSRGWQVTNAFPTASVGEIAANPANQSHVAKVVGFDAPKGRWCQSTL